jgi:hypothetical protein
MQGMRLLVSTPLRLMVVSPDDVRTVHSGRQEDGNGNYHGITWAAWEVFVTGSKDFRYVVFSFDRDFNELGVLDDADLHQCHQALWDETSDALYVTNTGKNRVEVWQRGEWTYTHWNPSPCDIDHVNGIWSDGRLFYVTEFRHRPSKPSVVRVCEPDLTLLETRLVGPPIHNVYVENGRMFNLVSRQFKGILETDLRSSGQLRHHVRGEENNLVRGLARTAEHWFVGLSRWEPERGERHKGDAVVVVLDNWFEEVGRIVVPDAGPVCDVRAIHAPDLAHNGVAW